MMCLRVARFVRVAERDARVSRVVIMGQTGGANCNERYGWREMTDPAFRAAVLATLERRQTLREPRFSCPDEYDEWTFYAYPRRSS